MHRRCGTQPQARELCWPKTNASTRPDPPWPRPARRTGSLPTLLGSLAAPQTQHTAGPPHAELAESRAVTKERGRMGLAAALPRTLPRRRRRQRPGPRQCARVCAAAAALFEIPVATPALHLGLQSKFQRPQKPVFTVQRQPPQGRMAEAFIISVPGGTGERAWQVRRALALSSPLPFCFILFWCSFFFSLSCSSSSINSSICSSCSSSSSSSCSCSSSSSCSSSCFCLHAEPARGDGGARPERELQVRAAGAQDWHAGRAGGPLRRAAQG